MLGTSERTQYEVSLWRAILEDSFNKSANASEAKKDADEALKAFREAFPEGK